MSGDMWLEKYERIGEMVADGKYTRDEAEAALVALGLDSDEIGKHLDALFEDEK